jgi:hypothetical protein
MESFVSEVIGQKLTNMEETDKAYIAGYMDGEGCFRWNNCSAEVSVKSCNPYPMKRIAEFFGGNIKKQKQKTKRGKTVYQLRYYGDTSINFLNIIKEYLIEKRDQAETMIQLYELNLKLQQAKRKDHNEH